MMTWKKTEIPGSVEGTETLLGRPQMLEWTFDFKSTDKDCSVIFNKLELADLKKAPQKNLRNQI